MASSSTLSPLALGLVFGIVGLLGCRAEPNAPGQTSTPGLDTSAELRSPTPAPDLRFASRGVPHTDTIAAVALSPEGEAALTRDTAGGLRLWASLDGSSEPLVVPVRDPRLMALAPREDGGMTLALGDAVGGVRLIGVDASGSMQKLASLSPTDPVIDLAVLPGGERVLALGADHVLRLLDRQGQTLARLDEPGLRMKSVRLATAAGASGRELAVVALTVSEADPELHQLRFEALTIEVGDASLARGPWTQSFHSDVFPSADNPSLSPDGRALVFVDQDGPGSRNCEVVAKQLEDGRQISVPVTLTNAGLPRLSLLAGGRVLLDDGSSIGRVVDFAARTVTLRSLRSAPMLAASAGASRPGLRVAPAGTWLAVHDLGADQLHYLGYEPMSVTYAGLAPAAEHAAWAIGDRVVVETTVDEASEALTVPGTEARSHRLAEFLDPDHLVLVDWTGIVELVDWRSGEVLGHTDLGTDVQQASFARAPEASGALVARTNLWANPVLVEFRAGAIGASYIAQAPANFVGPLRGTAGALDSWGMWTIDGAGKLRELEFGRLGAGLDSETELGLGTELAAGMPELYARGRAGVTYWTRSSSLAPELHVEGREADEVFSLAPGTVIMLEPSPDNSHLAIVQQRDPNRILSVYDMDAMQPVWAQPVPMVNALSWSDDSQALALATTLGGGAVFDTASGRPRLARCGLAFERRRTPPRTLGGATGPNICEL